MKKISIISSLALFILSEFFLQVGSSSVYAAEVVKDGAKYSLNADRTSVVADGKDEINFSFSAFFVSSNQSVLNYQCANGASAANPQPYLQYVVHVDEPTGMCRAAQFYITLDGPGEMQGDTFDVYGGIATNAQTGKYDFSLSSAEAGTTTVSVSVPGMGSLVPYISSTVSFSESPPVQAQTSSVAANTSSASTLVTKSKPTLSLSGSSKTTSIGENITINPSGITTISPNQTMEFKGLSEPGAKITINIKSKIITKEVIADGDGNWSFDLNPKILKLAVGEHLVEAYAESNGLKSDAITLAKFNLKKISPQAEDLEEEDMTDYFVSSFSGVANYFLFGSLMVLVGAFIVLKRNPVG